MTTAVETTPLLHEKFQNLSSEVTGLFVNRHEEVEVAVTSLLAREHCCFLGDPGIAKSAVIEELVQRIGGGAQYFWVQLFGETPPTDVFGQMSLKALREEDVNKRNVQGHLPTAHVAFLDEIFQARSTILVGCNSIMQERKYMNGVDKVDVPLISMFGASNFYPEDPQLCALWDRFIARKYVRGLDKVNDIKKMLNLPEPPNAPKPVVQLMDLWDAHVKVDEVTVPAGVIDCFVELLTQLKGLDTPIEVSDRRKRKSMKYLQAKAFLGGRNTVSTTDLPVLRYVLWTKPDHIQPVEDILEKYKPLDPAILTGVIDAIRPQVEQTLHLRSLGDEGAGEFSASAGMLLGKVNDAITGLKKSKSMAASDPENYKVYKSIMKELTAWQEQLLQGLGAPVDGMDD